MRSQQHFSAFTCKATLVAVVVLAAVSSVHAEPGYGCNVAMIDKASFGWGYETYISFGASEDPSITRRKGKCGSEQTNTFGVINDSLEGDAWVVSLSGNYEMVINPAQIVLKQTINGKGHAMRKAPIPSQSGTVGARLIWFDTITPHVIDKPKHSYKPKPTLPQLQANLKGYMVLIKARAWSDGPVQCTTNGDYNLYWYTMIANMIAFADINWGNGDPLADPHAYGGSNLVIQSGEVAPGHSKCLKGSIGGTYAAFDGWPSRIRLRVQSAVNAGGSPLKSMSGQAQVDVPDFHMCLTAPDGVELTSASGHDYTCPQGMPTSD
jgi:hypothetical protein